jgi:hypothetical protein
MNKTTEERLRDAEERARQAILAVRALKSARHQEQRRREARCKVILGAWLMANRPDLVESIKAGLKRPQDRYAFGLDERPPAYPAGAEPNVGDLNA